ncbi:MAG: excinuclease ABC subunit UvrC [Clostridiales bacterium]|nr:excinuclease ABC subunit UvrC [Clostridiales bacterium]
MSDKLKDLRKKAMSLPLTPGVYIMKNDRKEVIYVGKAKALKNRVSQYFGSQNNHSVKVLKMVSNVDDFDYILCDSEFEALVLECSLIKQYMPKYNILLKDDKGYSYLKVKTSGWMDFSLAYQKKDDGFRYIGPFMSGSGLGQSVENAKKIFLLPTCSKQFPRDIGKTRPCLNYHIGQCAAPCSGRISMSEHNEAVKQALEFITDGSGKAVAGMKKQMLELSENLEFEKAAKLRDKIKAAEKILNRQKVINSNIEEQDVFALVSAGVDQSAKSCLAVLRFREGRLYDSDHFIIDTPDDLPYARDELIRRYYSSRDYIPSRVSVDGACGESDLTGEYLSSLAGRKVSIIIPQKGEQHSLVEMCRANASQKLALYLGRSGAVTSQLDELAGLLGLKVPPQYIESYDISHTAGSDNVASMVVFKNGLPYKKMYRKFSIKGFTGQDDYASMAEVIDRRFNEYEKADKTAEGFGTVPDLILLDGGIGQVNAVLPILKKHNLNIPLFGMVKDSHHKTRAITSAGGEISITSKRKAFTLVSSIQEEVHRFAVAYHHQKHKKSTLKTILTGIEGIGEKRANRLLKEFKTIKAISLAGIDELNAVEGMNINAARNVYNTFHEAQKK